MKTLAKALIAGMIITLVLFGCAWLAAERDLLNLSYLLYWQGYVLGMLVPCETVEILGVPQCQATSTSVAAFYGGIPLGIVVYTLLSLIAMAVYRILTRK